MKGSVQSTSDEDKTDRVHIFKKDLSTSLGYKKKKKEEDWCRFYLLKG